MSRYIDADALLNRLPDDLPYKASVKRVLIQAPTADVVEVVRCKDCKHWEHEGTDYLTQRPFGICKCECWEHPTEYLIMLDNDYCSHGERKENAET